MRVLGVDPGTLCTGWGIVETLGSRPRGVDAGAVRLSSQKNLSDRLWTVYQELLRLIDQHQPQAVAVEGIFFAKYPSAALKLGHVRGVVLLAAAARQVPVHEHSPAVVKRCVTGSGKADKQQVARIVGAMLGWRDLPVVDATDALAVALTHLQTTQSPLGRLLSDQRA